MKIHKFKQKGDKTVKIARVEKLFQICFNDRRNFNVTFFVQCVYRYLLLI